MSCPINPSSDTTQVRSPPVTTGNTFVIPLQGTLDPIAMPVNRDNGHPPPVPSFVTRRTSMKPYSSVLSDGAAPEGIA